MRKQYEVFISLLVDMRLKLNSGTYKTLYNINPYCNSMSQICETCIVSLFSKVTNTPQTALYFINFIRQLVMWFVAPLSIIQFVVGICMAAAKTWG